MQMPFILPLRIHGSSLSASHCPVKSSDPMWGSTHPIIEPHGRECHCPRIRQRPLSSDPDLAAWV